MAVKGRFPNKMIKNHFRAYEQIQLEPFFNETDYRFRSHEVDPVTSKRNSVSFVSLYYFSSVYLFLSRLPLGKPVLKILDITNPTRDLSQLLRSSKVR
jgi:hypothetical protein